MKNKIYYSWECPPRTLIDGNILNFDVDFDKIFLGIKLDEYTELPKILEFKDIEKSFLESNPDCIYYKIIADTNAYSLSPKSKDLIGDKKLKLIFSNYKAKIQILCDNFYGTNRVKVVLFTELIKDYLDLYFELFNDYQNDFDNLVKFEEFMEIKKYLKEHVGIKVDFELEKFTKKVIVSYIVEGIIIPKVFFRPLWVNFDEPLVLANYTNCLQNQIEIINVKNYLSSESGRND